MPKGVPYSDDDWERFEKKVLAKAKRKLGVPREEAEKIVGGGWLGRALVERLINRSKVTVTRDRGRGRPFRLHSTPPRG